MQAPEIKPDADRDGDDATRDGVRDGAGRESQPGLRDLADRVTELSGKVAALTEAFELARLQQQHLLSRILNSQVAYVGDHVALTLLSTG